MESFQFLILGLLLFILVILNIVLLYNIRIFILSPIYTFVFFMQLMLLSTSVYSIIGGNINLFGFEADVNSHLFIRTINSYLVVLISFISSVLLCFLFDSKKKIFRETKRVNFTKRSFLRLFLALFAIVTSLVMLFLVYGYGVFERTQYIPSKDGVYIMKNILFVFNFIAVILIGNAYKNFKWLSLILFFIFLFFNLTTASRRMIIYCIIYLLTIFPAIKTNMKGTLFKLIYFSSSAILFMYTLNLRKLSSHGLFPYLSNLKNIFSDVYDIAVFSFYYVFIYGFFVTSKTIAAGKANLKTTIIAINPLPGGIAGWHEIHDSMRINVYAPYNLYGEIMTIGLQYVVLFFLILGLLFYSFEKRIRKLYILSDKNMLAVVLFLFLLLFTIYSTQYNFRSSMRLLYYLLFITLGLKITRRI